MSVERDLLNSSFHDAKTPAQRYRRDQQMAGKWFNVPAKTEFPLRHVYAHLRLFRDKAKRSLHVMAPSIPEYTDEDEYLLSSMTWHSLHEYYGLVHVRENLERSALHHQHTKGKIHRPNDDVVLLKLGTRRGRPLTEEEIAQAVFFAQSSYSGWSHLDASPELYSKGIAPALQSSSQDDPFEWALHRAEAAAGFSWELRNSDFPADYAMHPYTQVASRVCNTTPTRLQQPRRFALNAHSKALLKEAERLFPEHISPELVSFLLEQSSHFDPDLLSDPAVVQFIQRMPHILNNGLVIDRLSQATQHHIQIGATGAQAITHTTALVTNIFGQDSPPWWFKEDFDLTATYPKPDAYAQNVSIDWLQEHSQLPCNEHGRQTERGIAKSAGFAYQYALALYTHIGHRLHSVAEIDQARAIDFCTAVTNNYGIGNVQRAQNILAFALSMLQETPSKQRAAALRMLEEHLEEVKPPNLLVGRMEGEDVDFEKPGIGSMLAALYGEAWAKREGICNLSIKMQHLQQAATGPLRALPHQRASIAPSLPKDLYTQRTHLLTTASRHQLALSPPEESTAPACSQTPVLGTIALYDRIRNECTPDCAVSDLADIYGMFCMHRMPDPFNPPPGFFRLLERFDTIKNPHRQLSILVEPKARASNDVHNAKQIIDKYLVLTNLLNAWATGIVAWNDVEELLEWMTVECDKQTQVDCHWHVHQEHRRHEKTTKSIYAQSVEEGMDEATARKHRDDWLRIYEATFSKNVDQALLDKINPTRWERVQCLGSCTDFIPEIQGLVAIKLISPSFAQRYTQQLLIGVRDDSVHVKNIPNVSPAIKQFVNNGMLDTESLQQTAQTQQLSLAQIVESANATCKSLTQAESQIAGFEDSLLNTLCDHTPRFGNESDGANQLDGLFEQLTAAVSQTLQSVPHVHWPAVHARLQAARSAESVWHVVRQTMTFNTQVRQQLTPPNSTCAQLNRRMHEVNVRTLTATYLAAAHRIFQPEDTPTPAAEIAPAAKESPRQTVNPATLQLANALSTSTQGQSAASLERLCQEALSHLGYSEEYLRRIRLKYIGLQSIGAKIHLVEPTKPQRIELLNRIIPLQQSAFRLQHADTTIIVDPVPTPQEMKLLVNIMQLMGVIVGPYPEIQICGTKRLQRDNAAILGASVLLATDVCPEYDARAFNTTHDNITGARIMAYDAAGARHIDMPFNRGIIGRIDMLGRRSLNDFDLYQLANSILAQGEQRQGPFHHLAKPFKRRLRRIMDRYGIQSALRANWVLNRYQEEDVADSNFAHYQAIKTCTDAWHSCQATYAEAREQHGDEAPKTGVIFAVRNLFDSMRKEVDSIQEGMLHDPQYRDDLIALQVL